MAIKPIRVLQVLFRADRGGAETWLVHVAQHIDRQKVAMDFLVHDDVPGAYDAQIKAEGARIFAAPRHRNLFRQWYYLRKYQRRYGPFDIIHSHVDYYGGVVVFLAYLSGISVRIAHSHTDTREAAKAASVASPFLYPDDETVRELVRYLWTWNQRRSSLGVVRRELA